jgi:hypothetical protein
METVELNCCAICFKPYGDEKIIEVPMNFTGLWQKFKAHERCEIAWQKKYSKFEIK